MAGAAPQAAPGAEFPVQRGLQAFELIAGDGASARLEAEFTFEDGRKGHDSAEMRIQAVDGDAAAARAPAALKKAS